MTTVRYDLLNLGMSSGDSLVLGDDGRISDILRFDSDMRGVFVFSNTIDGADDPADIGIPFPNITSPISVTNELDLGGGMLGVTYKPCHTASPGFLGPIPGGFTYKLVSHVRGVPEPWTYLLVGAPLLWLFLRRQE